MSSNPTFKQMVDDCAQIISRIAHPAAPEIDDPNDLLGFLIDDDVARVEISLDDHLWDFLKLRQNLFFIVLVKVIHQYFVSSANASLHKLSSWRDHEFAWCFIRILLKDWTHLSEHPSHMPQEGFGVALKTVKMIPFNEFHESEIGGEKEEIPTNGATISGIYGTVN